MDAARIAMTPEERALRRARIAVEAEPVPTQGAIDPDAWVEWCELRGFDPLNGGRRAWIQSLETYLRGAEYLLYREGQLIDLAYEQELEFDPEAIPGP